RGRTWVLLVESYDSAAPSADDDFGEWFGRDLLPALARADQDVRVVVSGRERLPAGAWQELDIGAYSPAMDGHDPGSRGIDPAPTNRTKRRRTRPARRAVLLTAALLIVTVAAITVWLRGTPLVHEPTRHVSKPPAAGGSGPLAPGRSVPL